MCVEKTAARAILKLSTGFSTGVDNRIAPFFIMFGELSPESTALTIGVNVWNILKTTGFLLRRKLGTPF
jgi:hypothetical protein